MKKLMTIGIPSNERLRQDVQPALEASIGLRETRSGKLECDIQGCNVVSLKLSDMIRFLVRDKITLGLLSDDKANEWNGMRGKQRLSAGFRMMIDQPPVFSVLAREEDEQLITDLLQAAPSSIRAFTSYPSTVAAASVAETGWKPGFKITQLDGQVESFLRNGLYDEPAIAYDLVRSGRTAEKYDLSKLRPRIPGLPTGKPQLPGFWSRKIGTDSGVNVPSVLDEIKERLAGSIEIVE